MLQSLGTWRPDEEYCGLSLHAGNILNGKNAAPGEFPFLALLGFYFDNDPKGKRVRYGCGGSIVNAWYVLTAAHCVTHSKQELV